MLYHNTKEYLKEMGMKLKILLLGCAVCLSGCANSDGDVKKAICSVQQDVKEMITSTPVKQPVCTGSIVKGCQPVIYFDVNKSDLTDESIQNLDWVVQKMTRYDRYHVALTGHADVSGTTDKNLQLSEERVNAVRAYLIKQKISADRIEGYYKGANEPICTEEYCKELSRRVEMYIYVSKDNVLTEFFNKNPDGQPTEIIVEDLK